MLLGCPSRSFFVYYAAMRRPVKGKIFTKIISGGQTGVDRAALDVALQLGLEAGGWCPRGRRAEDGNIPLRYPLQETASWRYPARTRQNVLESDGTLILSRGAPPETGLWTWGSQYNIQVLNVAGPRESEAPHIYEQAFCFLTFLLAGSVEKGRNRTSRLPGPGKQNRDPGGQGFPESRSRVERLGSVKI